MSQVAATGIPVPAQHTKRFNELQLTDIRENEYVIFPESSSEDRGYFALWDQIKAARSRNYIEISDIEKESFAVTTNGIETESVSCLNEEAIFNLLKDKNIIIDISGLPYNIWAPIIKVAFNNNVITRVIYTEPESYSLHKNPSSSALFDLSIEFEGSAPLPGFAKLDEPEDGKSIFVALLGFEGYRPRSLIYHLDPSPKVIPVVGVPGFQVEFPTYTITCNQELLEESQAYSDIRLSRASCPFEVYDSLREIRKDYPEHYMYIAPVGTKPHGLGGILFSISNTDSTEIVFDHPVRKKGRTKGIGAIHIYDFGNFDGY